MVYALDAMNRLIDKGFIHGKKVKLSKSARRATKGFEPTDEELKPVLDGIWAEYGLSMV